MMKSRDRKTGGLIQIKACNSGGWFVECNYYLPNGTYNAEQHVAATPEGLVDLVLKFAAQTSDVLDEMGPWKEE